VSTESSTPPEGKRETAPLRLSAAMAAEAESIAAGSKVTTEDILETIREMREEREEHFMRLFENRWRKPESLGE